jgi:thioredoxin reductase (NADPH)
VTSDVVIVGAGPAGASAALWARSLDLVPLVLEASASSGGQLHIVHFHPQNLAGVADGDGAAIAGVLAKQLAEARIEVRGGSPAAKLEGGSAAGPARVITADGVAHEGSAVVVASGARRRRLEVPGERELEGRGVSFSATGDRAMLAGRRVVVVGGGNAAFENALLLSGTGSPVTIVVRDQPHARREFVQRVAQDPRIEVLEGASVTAIRGSDRVTAVAIEHAGRHHERPAEGVVVKVGMVPNTEWCAGALDLDPDGYVRVDAALRSSHPRAWAVGDVTHPAVPSLAVAIGQGAQAMGAIRAVLRPN